MSSIACGACASPTLPQPLSVRSVDIAVAPAPLPVAATAPSPVVGSPGPLPCPCQARRVAWALLALLVIWAVAK